VDYAALRAMPGYLQQPIPNQTDREIDALIAAIERMDPIARSTAVKGIRSAHTAMLLCYAERMAILAVRTQNVREVEKGIIAAGLACRAAPDLREVLVKLGVLWDACLRSGGDGEREFRAAAELVPTEGAKTLVAFASRADLDGILDAMGYTVGSDSAGQFEYKRLW
jgi:hypothetical protein